jgi:hypothetical protein
MCHLPLDRRSCAVCAGRPRCPARPERRASIGFSDWTGISTRTVSFAHHLRWMVIPLTVDTVTTISSFHSRFSNTSTATLAEINLSNMAPDIKLSPPPFVSTDTLVPVALSAAPSSVSSGRVPSSTPASTTTTSGHAASTASWLLPSPTTTVVVTPGMQPAARMPTPLSKSQLKFAGIIAFLRADRQKRLVRVARTTILDHRTKNPGVYSQVPAEFHSIIQSAKAIGVIRTNKKGLWFELTLD